MNIDNSTWKYPDKWVTKDDRSSKLTKDEKLSLIMIYKLEAITPKFKELEKEQDSFGIFGVLERENKAIGFIGVYHLKENKQLCNGHIGEIVEYDKEDKNTLIEEMSKIGMTMAKQTANDPRITMLFDVKNGMLYMKTPEDVSNEDIMEQIEERIKDEDNKQQIEQLEVVKEILKEQTTQSITEKTETISKPVLSPLQEKDIERSESLKKELAKTEKALIKKYGKDKIEELAKKIKYKGEIINKQ